MEKGKINKFRVIFKSIVKHIKIPYLILFIVLISVNTYAWFVYSNKVSSNIDVHVRGWDMTFTSKDDVVADIINFEVSNMQPGMEDYNEVITIHNNSEVSSRIHYNVLEAHILGDDYISKEGKAKKGLEVLEDDISSAELDTLLKENFPFVIEMIPSKEYITAEDLTETFTISLRWSYESGNDELDTLWGNRAYQYMRDNDTINCIQLSVELIVEQVTEIPSTEEETTPDTEPNTESDTPPEGENIE